MLFDTNVVLGLLLEREPFSQDAARCFSLVESGAIGGWLCASTETTLHCLIKKSVGAGTAFDGVFLILSLFEIAPVNKSVLESALLLPFKDFEDAVLHEAARHSDVGVIVTRNVADFKNSSIPIQFPENLLYTE